MKIRKPRSGIVLFLLCLMYFSRYIDRVNVSTAASSIKKSFGFSNTPARARLLGLRLSLCAVPGDRRMVAIGLARARRCSSARHLAVATALTGLATVSSR